MAIIGIPALAIVAILALVMLARMGATAGFTYTNRIFWGTAAIEVLIRPLIGVLGALA